MLKQHNFTNTDRGYRDDTSCVKKFKTFERLIGHPEFIDDDFLTEIYLLELASTGDRELAKQQVKRFLDLKKDIEKLNIN
jgi:hypothetical protein